MASPAAFQGCSFGSIDATVQGLVASNHHLALGRHSARAGLSNDSIQTSMLNFDAR